MFTCCNYLPHYLWGFCLFLSSSSSLLLLLLLLMQWPSFLTAIIQSFIKRDRPTLTWAPPGRWPEPERWSPSCPPGRCTAGCRWSRTLWTPWRCGPCGRRSWSGRPSRTGLRKDGMKYLITVEEWETTSQCSHYNVICFYLWHNRHLMCLIKGESCSSWWSLSLV